MFLFKLITCLIRGHKFEFERNIYGDEINERGGKRSEYWCSHCGLYQYRNSLHEKSEE